MASHNPMRVSWPVTVVAVGLFAWAMWTLVGVWQSMGSLVGPSDAVQGGFVGPDPVVGLMGLVVLAVFLGGLVALVGEASSGDESVDVVGR